MPLFTQIPSEPTASLVVVNNIAIGSSEKTVRDFFLFCGKIKELELQKSDDGEHQAALVLFDRESAAKTAILLSNALIDESHISVEPYFKDVIPGPSDDTENPSNIQETKTVTNVIAEILASGYKLQDQIIAKGLEYDTRYGVTSLVQSYFARIQENGMPYVKAVDEKYRVYDTVAAKATELDIKYGIQEKAQSAAQQAQTTAQSALATSAGQRVQELANQTLTQIAAVHAEAKRIAAENATKSTTENFTENASEKAVAAQ